MNSGTEKVELREVLFTPELLRCIPAATARMYSVLPIFDAGDCLGIVMLDPSRIEAIDELAFITGRSLQVRTAAAEEIRAFIDMHYGGGAQ